MCTRTNLVITPTTFGSPAVVLPTLSQSYSPINHPIMISPQPGLLSVPNFMSMPKLSLNNNEMRPTSFYVMQENGKVMSMDASTVSFDKSGVAVAPFGYTAVYVDPSNGQYTVPSQSNQRSSRTGSPRSTAPSTPSSLSVPVSPFGFTLGQGVPVPSMSVNSSEESGSDRSECGGAESADSDKILLHTEKKRKFPHRSKQKRIEEVEKDVSAYFTKKGVFAPGVNELRGEDTCRVHVKTYQALNKIFRVLKEIYNNDDLTMVKLALVVSMKNRFQKKGFIVYVKCETPVQRSVAQRIFGKYPEWFKNCEVARNSTSHKKRGYYHH